MNQYISFCKWNCIEDAVLNWNEEINSIATELGIPYSFIEKQARLHFPYLTEYQLKSSSIHPFPSSLRDIILSKFKNYSKDFDFFLQESGAKLLQDTSTIISKNFIHEMGKGKKPGKRLFKIILSNVNEIQGTFIEEKLHYLQSKRLNIKARFGIFIEGFNYPICYMSIVPIDRYYRISSLSRAMGITLRKEEVVNLARVYGFGKLPYCAISKLVSFISLSLRSQGVRFITTSINPLLGFNGISMKASGFFPFAFCPVYYGYNKSGAYLTRRAKEHKIRRSKLETPPNLLLVRNTMSKDRNFAENIIMANISEYLYFCNQEVPDEFIMDSKYKYLRKFRSELEEAWDEETRYQGASYSSSDPISKGQCGVTSAYLAQQYSKEGRKVYYCEGKVRFPNDSLSIDHHCWLRIPELNDGDTKLINLIIDLTADQNGFSEAIVFDTNDNLMERGIFYESISERPLSEVPKQRLINRIKILEERLHKKNVSATLI